MNMSTKKARSIGIGILLSVFSLGYAFYSSCSEEGRDDNLLSFEKNWKKAEQEWFDSNMVQSARKDSLLRAVIENLEAIKAHEASVHSVPLVKEEE